MLFKNWWTYEKARFNRHPIFWTVAAVLSVGVTVHTFYELHRDKKDYSDL